MLEHGAYNLLLDYYYADEQPLPLDQAELYTMVRAMSPADRKAVDKIIAKYFVPGADGYHQKRADHEIEVSQKARTNGKGGGRPTGKSETESGTGNETGSITGYETDEETGEITEMQTGQGAGIVHPPTTNHQPLNHQPLPPTTNHQPKTKQSQPRSPGASPPDEPKTQAVWRAYGSAYHRRYGEPPIRNAMVNGQMAQFCKRVPATEAPEISAFYVASNNQFYVSKGHAVGLLLADAEKLRTEWATGRSRTQTEARQADRTQALGNVFQPLIEEARERERIANGSK